MTRDRNAKQPCFPLVKKFPSRLEVALYTTYNSVENRLWPLRPSFYLASAAAIAAVQYKHGIVSLPKFENKLLEASKIAVLSLAAAYVPVLTIRQFLSSFFFSYKGWLFENAKKPSLTTRFWGLLRKTLQSFAPVSLKSADRLLPCPPCPDLEYTVETYLESIKHLHSPEELAIIKEMSSKFLKEEGKSLHMYARIYRLFTDNYVTPFWQKYAYLYNKNCVLINSSVAHVDLIKDTAATRATRAAHVTYIEGLSHLAIHRQSYKPLGDGLLCARHYDNMYAVSRVPSKDCDYLVNYGISRHIAVYYKGGIYRVDICDEHRNIYTPEQLSKVFAELFARKDAEVKGLAGQLCALTTDKRDQWAVNRQRFFVENKTNAKTLEMIESSIFFFDMDENETYGYDAEKPEVLSNFFKNMLTGDGTNRWADKSLNYILSANTRCGGTTEHSIADGSEFDHIMENFVYLDTQFVKYPSIEEQQRNEEDYNNDKTITFARKYEVEVNEEMSSEIERCMAEYKLLSDDVDIVAIPFRDFGKGLIKKCGVSPDAFMQMAIQLANYRDQGKFVLTYEPASARFYRNSRTETLRTVSDASCEFVLAMVSPEVENSTKIEKLKSACESHGKRNRMCMVGKGIDRHLFVLYVLSKGTGISSPFLDHYINQPWLLSTSHVPNVTNQVDEDKNVDETWLGACFGAVAKNGYGVCYRFGGNHSILCQISSYHSAENTNSERFSNNLKDALKEIAGLFNISP